MADSNISLRTIYKAILADAKKDSGRVDSKQPKRDYAKAADEFRRAGKTSWALNILSPLKQRYVSDPYFNFVFALVCRDIQDMESAYSHASIAASLAPGQPDTIFAQAQFAFETWRPSVELFEKAQELDPDNLNIKKNLAQAYASEDRAEQGKRILEQALLSLPDWLEGHQQLASLNVITGESKPFETLAQSCCSQPDNLQQHLAWFYLLAQAGEWEDAVTVLEAIPAHLRQENRFLLSWAYCRAETGGELTEKELTGPLSQLGDPGFDLCCIRYFLRKSQPERAEEVAAKYMGSNHSRLFWPYLALCWRLTGDTRSDWLEADGGFVSEVDLELDKPFLTELSDELRNLQSFTKPYLEQSVKGGTQTNRNIFFNPSPRIQRVRRSVTEAVNNYKSSLTTTHDGHPLLSCVPESTHYSGAWSVALSEQGYHSTHTHVKGWLSSALYISIPPDEDLGMAPAGYLSLGQAPSGLNLNLDAYKEVKPKTGKLVLFPSYTWHGTAPFTSGERLSMAFDISPV